MIVHARDESIAALDPMHETLLTQEIEGAIDGDRRRSPAVLGEPVDQFIGAERLMAGEQGLQNTPAHRREALPACGAELLRMRDGIARATAVIVCRVRKNSV